MRLGNKRIMVLQALLKEQTGHDYNIEEAQQAGLAIMRFIVSKHHRSAVTREEIRNETADT